jgi:hypothetical protein
MAQIASLPTLNVYISTSDPQTFSGLAITQTLVSSSQYTTLSVSATPFGMQAGQTVTITYPGLGGTQDVTLTSAAPKGSTSIAVKNFQPTANASTGAAKLSGSVTPTPYNTDDSVLVDVTLDVKDVRTRFGKQHELDRHETGTCTITLDNRTGLYTPWAGTAFTRPTKDGGTISTSPAAMAVPMSTVIVKATWNGTTYPVFYGFVQSWTLNTPDEVNSEVSITATDVMKVLSTTRLNNPNAYVNNLPYPANVATYGPAQLVPMNDTDGIGGMNVTNWPSSTNISIPTPRGFGTFLFSQTGPLVYSKDTAMAFSSDGQNPTGYVGWTDVNPIDAQLDYHLEVWVQNPTAGDVIIGNFNSDTPTWTGVKLNNAGIPQMVRRTLTSGSPTDAVLDTSSTGRSLTDGDWHHVAYYIVTNTGTDVQNLICWIDGVQVMAASKTYSTFREKARQYQVGGWVAGTSTSYLPAPASLGTFALALVDDGVSLLHTAPYGPATRYHVGQMVGYRTTTDDRVEEALTVAGLYGYENIVPAIPVPTSLDQGYAYVGQNPNPTTTQLASEVILQTSDTELGAFYADQSGTLIFRNRFYPARNQQATISPAAVSDQTVADARYISDVSIVNDDLDLWNQAEITDTNGTSYVVPVGGASSASSEAYGQRTMLRSTYADGKLQAQAIGQTITFRHKNPQTRIDRVTLGSESGDPTTTTMLSLDLWDTVTFERRDAGSAILSRPYVIESIQHEFVADPGHWHVSLTLSPFEIYQTPYIVFDDQQSTASAPGTDFLLNAALSSGTTYTSLTVKGPGGSGGILSDYRALTVVTLVHNSDRQYAVLAQDASAGDTTLTIQPLTANANYPATTTSVHTAFPSIFENTTYPMRFGG